jgi:hypothetical protein
MELGHWLERDRGFGLPLPHRRIRCEPDFRGSRTFTHRRGEALHPDREPLETLKRIRGTVGEYNFAGQYQQSPAPLGGSLVKSE